MKYLIMIFMVCVCCISCTNKERKEKFEGELIKIDFSKEYKDKKFPNTNYSMKILRLEDNEEYPIGIIDKIIVNKDKIYILDRSKAKALFIYSINGEFLNTINQRGAGPGEFTSLQDFDIEKKTGNIIIMDINSRKLVFYSSEGTHVKDVKFDFFATNFIVDNDDNIIFDHGNIPSKDNYRIVKTDINGNLSSSFFPSDPSTVGITFNPRISLQQCDNQIFFLPTLTNEIYTIEDENYNSAYKVDFGKNWPSESFFEKVRGTHPLKIREMMIENDYVCFLNYIQTPDVLHLDFYKGKNYSFYYNKKTKQSLLIAMEDESFSFPLATYGDEFIFVKYKEDTGVPVLVFYTVNFELE